MIFRSALESMVGCRSWSSEAGSMRVTASSGVISPSLASSTAILSAARAVRLPARAGEFEVLHVAVMALERVVDARELGKRLRHRPFHGGFVGMGENARFLGDLLRRADAGDHILA